MSVLRLNPLLPKVALARSRARIWAPAKHFSTCPGPAKCPKCRQSGFPQAANKAAKWSVLGGKVLFLAPHKPFFGWCFGTVLAVVSGNLQAFSCYGLVTNWQFFACGAPFVGRSPRTPPTDVCYPIGGAREKAAKNGWILPGQGTQLEISRPRNILPAKTADPPNF